MPDITLSNFVLSESQWTTEVEVFKQGTVTNEGGYAIPSDNDNSSDLALNAIIRPAQENEYGISSEGRSDNAQHLMIVKTEANVEISDEVKYHGKKYTVQSPESDINDGFTIFELHEVID
jgi:hypothetical protein